MSISSRFSVAIHILCLLAINKDKATNTSEYIAGSVNTNPVVIRKVMSMLKGAGLVHVRAGVAGAELAKELQEITLLDVYKAVNVVAENDLFSSHEHPNPECIVGRNIQHSLTKQFSAAQKAMEHSLEIVTLADVVHDILMSDNV
ncbi:MULTISPECIES: Rrf2 family transcriptional regulator [Paenibacillus]|uniref:Rrf2 family transcriptional regulator n=1 Tax=Paenibacillus azoreducens TaxID=116718 RepID=A0A919YHC7_9BACL|nr:MULTISPECIES: Rrf2 family transcriptional regulator [Paenibacillus]MBE9916518.1 Rrf2 family transcriptional regulator [Paenibacillus donghaensis]GIO50519.1 Rrf2 family transcriptional regulator [Paenibacillus azoreducens]